MRWLSVLGFVFGISLILLLALTGSYDVISPLDIQDDAALPAGELFGAHTVGQTFVAHCSRLSAIQVRWVVSEDFSFAPNSRVIFHLRQRVDDSAELATIAIPLSQVQPDQFSTFSFPPLADSQGQSYYFFLDASQAEITRGWFSTWASDDDALPNGRMYLDEIATNRDLAFRAFSSPDVLAMFDSLGKTFAREATGIPVAVLILLVPGLALALSFSTPREIPAEIIALIGGLGMAALSAAALLVLWLRVSVLWLLVVIVLLVVSAILVIRNRTNAKPTIVAWNRRAIILLAALALLSFAVGFIQFGELPAPLWVDSYAHASYAKDFLDQGRLALNRIYHFGYHSIVALLIQMTGISLPQAMLLGGQLIVVQIGLSFFLFSKRLTESDIAGLVSAICVWFLTPTPMYFLTWGRYPLLLGTAILPMALTCAMDWIEEARCDARTYLLAVVTLMGLAFAHIRLLAFYVVFVAIDLAWHNLRARRLGASVARVVLLAIAGLVIGMLWLAALASQHDVAQDIAARVELVSGVDIATATAILQSHHGPIVWAIAAIGIIVALVRRNHSALIVVVWFGALLAIAAVQPYFISGEVLTVPFVALMGFFPAALLIGELARFLFAKFGANTRDAIVWLGIGACVSLLGAREMLSLVNPTTILFTRADAQAMTWIQANTPNDARFLVNSFAWYPSSYAPSDGGSWIPYYTNRAVVFADNSITPDALARWVDARRVTYVYLGRRTGVLHTRDLADAPERYALVYEEEGIRIFRVKGR